MIIYSEFMQGFRDVNPAIALTFVVQAAQLEKRTLDRLLADFPKARGAVHRAAYRLTFRRAMVLVAASAR